MSPLDTIDGQEWLDDFIKHIGGVDLLILDNIMSLTVGAMVDEEGWKPVVPWMRSLTKRNIGCLWVHHTGHLGSRGYGTKTREWQLDTVMVGEKVEGDRADIALRVTFSKARQRTPDNRDDFEPFVLRLENDQWTTKLSSSRKPKKKVKLSPLGKKFLDAFHEALADSDLRYQSWEAVHMNEWRHVCIKRGLLDTEKPKSASALLSKYRKELIAADIIRCDRDTAWLVVAERAADTEGAT